MTDEDQRLGRETAGGGVEVDLDDEAAEIVENDDGSAEVDLGADEEADEALVEEHFANLVETLSAKTLDETATTLSQLVEADIDARKERDERYAEGLRRTGLAPQDEGGPFEGSADVVHPVLVKAVIDFQAATVKELFPPSGPVKDKIIDASGTVTSVIDRTPPMIAANPLYSWKFQVMFDPVINNEVSIIAHSAVHLDEMDTDTQRPAFFGPLTGSGALAPLSAPVTETGHTVTTVTGTTTSGSALVTSVSSTADLRFGQTVTGTGIAANAYIASVDSASQITLSANATASNAGTSLTIKVGGSCGGIVALYPYLFFYGSSGRIMHSTNANFNDFWGTGSNEAFITAQKIVQAMPTRGGAGNSPSGLFWSLDSLIRASFVGGDPVFSYDTVSEGITIMSPRSIIEYDGAHFWMGVDRFFMYAGAVRELPNPFNLDHLFASINQTTKNRTFAFRNSRYGEIWWCVPTGTSEWPNHAFVFNVRSQFWYDTPLPHAGRSCAESALTWPYPILGGVDATDSNTYKLWQHETGVDEIDGTDTYAIRSYYQTGDISLLEGQQPQDKELQVIRIEPDFDQTGDMTVTVLGNHNARSSDYEESSATFSAAPDLRATIVPVKASRRQMRFRFESNTVGGDYKAGKPLAILNPTGGRAT